MGACGTAFAITAGAMKVRDLLHILVDDGWQVLRTSGSHRQLGHPLKRGTVTLSGKPGDDVPIGTLRSVLRQAGIN
jgi:predicted RNA binding protein YcfA (HicA-like mRNA interferase family)